MPAPTIVPPARPKIGRDAVTALLAGAGVDVTKPALVGRRGYYRDTMGAAGANDVGIYDDAIAIVTPTAFAAFNANTDPSRYFPRVAILSAGVWRYQIGTHGITKPKDRQYRALVQAAPVRVRRFDPDEGGDSFETGWFGINIHRGSYGSTSSEGCQTVFPDQWISFFSLVDAEMEAYGIDEIPYLLTEHAPIAE